MFWFIKVLVYYWAFSFLVVSNFWCLCTSPMRHFSNNIFHHKKHVCSCVCVSWTQYTMHISSICDTLLSYLSNVYEVIPVQIFLDFHPPSWKVLFLWNLETAYSLFVSVNLSLQYFNISFKSFFLVFEPVIPYLSEYNW